MKRKQEAILTESKKDKPNSSQTPYWYQNLNYLIYSCLSNNKEIFVIGCDDLTQAQFVALECKSENATISIQKNKYVVIVINSSSVKEKVHHLVDKKPKQLITFEIIGMIDSHFGSINWRKMPVVDLSPPVLFNDSKNILPVQPQNVTTSKQAYLLALKAKWETIKHTKKELPHRKDQKTYVNCIIQVIEDIHSLHSNLVELLKQYENKSYPQISFNHPDRSKLRQSFIETVLSTAKVGESQPNLFFQYTIDTLDKKFEELTNAINDELFKSQDILSLGEDLFECIGVLNYIFFQIKLSYAKKTLSFFSNAQKKPQPTPNINMPYDDNKVNSLLKILCPSKIFICPVVVPFSGKCPDSQNFNNFIHSGILRASTTDGITVIPFRIPTVNNSRHHFVGIVIKPNSNESTMIKYFDPFGSLYSYKVLQDNDTMFQMYEPKEMDLNITNIFEVQNPNYLNLNYLISDALSKFLELLFTEIKPTLENSYKIAFVATGSLQPNLSEMDSGPHLVSFLEAEICNTPIQKIEGNILRKMHTDILMSASNKTPNEAQHSTIPKQEFN